MPPRLARLAGYRLLPWANFRGPSTCWQSPPWLMWLSIVPNRNTLAITNRQSLRLTKSLSKYLEGIKPDSFGKPDKLNNIEPTFAKLYFRNVALHLTQIFGHRDLL